MKSKTTIWNCIPLLLSIVLAVGVKTFMGPCVHADGSLGACHWAGQALMGLGVLMAAEGLAGLFWKQTGVRKGIYLSLATTSVLSALIPGPVISVCSMASMRCRAVMTPAAVILSIAILIFSILNIWLECRKEKKGSK